MSNAIYNIDDKKDKLTKEAYKYYEKYVGSIPLKILPNGKTRPDLHNSEVDAFRHAYASGIMAMEYGENAANALGQGYELKNDYNNYNLPDGTRKQSPEQISKENNMDLWNNKIGRDISVGCASNDQLASKLAKALAAGQFITNPSDPRNYNLLTAQKIGDNYIVYGLDEDDVAAKYGVAKERVIENHSLNVDLTGRPTHSKSFIIKPDPEIDDSTYNEDNIKTEEEHSGYQPERNMINDFFKYYEVPEIHEEGINNLQRFERMHERAKLEGDNEFAGMFKNLAGAHKQVFDFLDNLNQEEDL
jgi:hypothetical protein